MARSNAYYYRRARQYALDVVSGKQPASIWTILAAKRFIDDRTTSKSENYPFFFDPNAAGKACRFIERMPLTKGEGASKKKRLILEPWQCFVVVNIFGWMSRLTGYRRFTEAYVKIPRKNGKSELAAAIGLYMLAADGEIGAEVFCGGRVENQARKVFGAAAEMVRKEKTVADFLNMEIWGPRRKPDAITVLNKNAKFEPLIGKPDDGDNPHCYICDEYHEHQTDDQFDTMKSGMGARTQGLILVITTAGGSIGGPCHQYEDTAKKVLKGVLQADHQFIAIWEADAEDDWREDLALLKANPNLNVSVHLSKLKKDRADAINRNKSSTFKAKHLNLWVGAEEAYFNVEAWLKARTHEDGLVTLEELMGRRCWLALDLAQKTDFCALAVWAHAEGRRGFDVWTKFWLPAETINATSEGHKYRRWADDEDYPPPVVGELTDLDQIPDITVTDGAMVDFDHVEEDVWRIWKLVDGVDLAFDPAHAAGIIPRLMKKGIPCFDFANTSKNMSDPMMLLDGYIREGLVRHSGNQVMDWMISNTVRRKSKRLDLDYPDRSMPDNKIDGVVATLMAIGRETFADEQPEPFIIRVR